MAKKKRRTVSPPMGPDILNPMQAMQPGDPMTRLYANEDTNA